MWKALAVLVVLAIGGVLGLALTKPDTFTVQRTTRVDAPPEKIYAALNDFHRWPDWSPWEKLDPAMKRTQSGSASGKGAVYEWDGNSKVGAGRMEILDSTPARRVAIKLDFLRPFEGHTTTEFTLQPRGDSSEVVWAMTGPAPFVSKLMQVFVDMDTMIGKDFEAGLANLKAMSEK
jgi:uncharacterized protein YndB with AHSA1/START domain